MKRSWLIGAALVFSLSAVACSDDEGEDGPDTTPDAGDSSMMNPMNDAGPGMDSGLEDASAGDAGDSDNDAG